jgi:hypothetical protein
MSSTGVVSRALAFGDGWGFAVFSRRRRYKTFVYCGGSINGRPEITYPVTIATPTTLPAALMVFAAWQRGQVH